MEQKNGTLNSVGKRKKVVGAAEVIRMIHDGDTVATEGFTEETAVEPETYYLKTGNPQNITLFYAAG